MSIWPQLETGGRRIGYARVSTADQRLDMQLDALAAVGCEPVFSDHGVSGAKASRPDLDAALKAVRAGDVFVVFKLDRLGRSVLHLADLLTRFHAEGVHFCSLSEGINTTTPGGKFVFHVFSAVAEFQRDMIHENTVSGLKAARERGKRLGRPPALDERSVLEAHRAVMQGGITVTEAARRIGASRATLSRSFERLGLATGDDDGP